MREDELNIFLLEHFKREHVSKITEIVVELTDQYTPMLWPNSNRSVRKSLEAERLYKIPPAGQTIKYCDLIDNTTSIEEYDRKFALVYLEEKRMILSQMDKGNESLYERVRLLLKKHQSIQANFG